MKMLSSPVVMIRNVGLWLVLMSLASQCFGYHEYSRKLEQGFYDGKCIMRPRGVFGLFQGPRMVDVEQLVADIVWSRYKSDQTIAPALIRMQFHDCFVNGCDASILLDGTESEKTARPNQSLRGFDLIDEIKDRIESICPGLVSCADIIAMATRDAVYFASPRESRYSSRYPVQTGRKDGFESHSGNVIDLPPPTATVSDSLKVFAKKSLNATDLVYLLGGGHSVGVTHCRSVQDRLSNFTNTGKPDPDMNKALVRNLKSYCDDPNKPIYLDQGTPNTMDNSLFKQVLFDQTGIFRGDQELAFHPQTRPTVEAITKGSYRDFSVNFGRAMANLQAVQVLTGSQGEVRRTCRAVNPKPRL